MPSSVAILGSGQMGLVLADVLASQGLDVNLWCRDARLAEELRGTRRAEHRLPGFTLATSVRVTHEPPRLFAESHEPPLVVNCVPTQFIRPVISRIADVLPQGTSIVSVAKGVEHDSLLLPLQIIPDAIGQAGGAAQPKLCALSGPTIAKELAEHLPATIIAASADEELALHVQQLFSVPWLRVYRLDDPLGVEVAGAVKNVIALAAGIVDGLQLGLNAKSALLSRGLAEITRLGVAMGARQETFFGIAGVGDLATTCFSPHSRNRSCGERLGRGETLDHILTNADFVIEGVATTSGVLTLAQRYGLEMPIVQAVYGVLFDGLTPQDAIRRLMSRDLKSERIG